MREKPVIQDEGLINLLWEVYGLRIARVEFLPVGADINAAKYRVETKECVQYFLKLKKGAFDEIPLLIPHFLHEQGIRQVIPPVKTKEGKLWTCFEGYACILYPYIQGRDAFELELSDAEWMELGSALKRIHSLTLPPALQGRLPNETWSPRYRELVRGFLAQVETCFYADPLAAQMAAFLQAHREEIRGMIERAESLAESLRTPGKPAPTAESEGPKGAPKVLEQERVLCHSDLHAWNILHSPQGGLHIIDWDEPILAPKERDLMFIGGGVGGIWNTPREEALFYRGYGETDIDLTALAYYRFERILVDVVEYSRQLLSASGASADREIGLRQFTAAFLPGHVVAMAYRTDQRLKEQG
jgi:spectinomycin phosphotransferase